MLNFKNAWIYGPLVLMLIYIIALNSCIIHLIRYILNSFWSYCAYFILLCFLSGINIM